MARLIDLDALLKACEEAQKSDPLADNRGWSDHFLNSAGEPSAEWWAIEDMIESQPIINAAPVVHGCWITKPPKYGYGKSRCSVCSVCGESGRKSWKFCPNCGARMDGGENGAGQ